MTTEQERWLDTNCYPPGAESVTNAPTLSRLPDSFGWARWLAYELEPRPVAARSVLDEVIGAGRTRGVLLCGAPGNGRHTVSNAIASTLSADGWYYLQLSGSRLELDGKKAALGALQEMFETDDEDVRICIALEDPEHCSWIAELYGMLVWALSYAAYPGHPEVFLVVLGQESEIPTELRALLQICRFACPDKAEREHYLREAMTDPPLEIDGMIPPALAEATEGFAYRQLETLLYFLRLAHREQIMANEPMDTWELFAEDTAKFARQHLPRRTVEQLIRLLRIAPQTPAPAPPQIVMQAVPAAPAAAQPGAAIDAANLSQEELQARYRAELDKLSYAELKAELERNVRRLEDAEETADEDADYETEEE